MIKRLLLASLTFALISCTDGGDDGDENLSTNACSAIGLNAKIVNGTECNDQGSAVVRLTIANSDGSAGLCSGTMITSRDVLTAAHCFMTAPVAQVSVSAGSTLAQASQIILHPQVRREPTAIFNDVAIVKLDRDVSLPTLPVLSGNAVSEGDVVALFGYGVDETGGSGALQSGETLISAVTDDHLLSEYDGVNGSNSCNGDSGGPAVFQTASGQAAVAGLVSTGQVLSCLAGDITLYSKVSNTSNLDFIVQNAPGVALL